MTVYRLPSKGFLQRQADRHDDRDHGYKAAVARALAADYSQYEMFGIGDYTLLLFMYRQLVDLKLFDRKQQGEDGIRLTLLRREGSHIAHWFAFARLWVPRDLKFMIDRFVRERFQLMPKASEIAADLRILIAERQKDREIPLLPVEPFAAHFGEYWVTPDGLYRWINPIGEEAVRYEMLYCVGRLLEWYWRRPHASAESDRLSFYQLYEGLRDPDY